LLQKKEFPVYADESIRKLNTISISAGTRGLQILLAPRDYLKITNASVAAIATNKFADTETGHG
jgi:Cys-tRNA(Pro)/Cys-tRNA(Cys) deacylase